MNKILEEPDDYIHYYNHFQVISNLNSKICEYRESAIIINSRIKYIWETILKITNRRYNEYEVVFKDYSHLTDFIGIFSFDVSQDFIEFRGDFEIPLISTEYDYGFPIEFIWTTDEVWISIVTQRVADAFFASKNNSRAKLKK